MTNNNKKKKKTVYKVGDFVTPKFEDYNAVGIIIEIRKKAHGNVFYSIFFISDDCACHRLYETSV